MTIITSKCIEIHFTGTVLLRVLLQMIRESQCRLLMSLVQFATVVPHVGRFHVYWTKLCDPMMAIRHHDHTFKIARYYGHIKT